MSAIKNLYYGNIEPCDLYVKKGSEYELLSKKLVELEDTFFETLNDSEKALYEQIWDHRGKQESIVEEDLFSSGFRLGARLMLEILTNPDRQFE